MMPLVVGLEWRIARQRPRLLALNVAIPLLLVAPVALSGAPAAHAAAVYAVLVTLFGTFGSAIPLVRDSETGMIQRIALTGIPGRRFVLERIAAQSGLDVLQLIPSVAVIAWVGAPGPELAATLPVVLAAALITANALGAWIAALARSLAEAALFAAVAALFALHAGGVFRTPAPGTAAAAIERLIPFCYLHEALLQTAGASAPISSGALLAGSVVGATLALAFSAAAAPLLASRLARIRHP